MTGEEKINKHLASIPKEEKLERMKESMYDWDTEILVDGAWANMQPIGGWSNEDLNDEYYEWFCCDYEGNEDYEDDVEKSVAPPSLKCTCGRGVEPHAHYCDKTTGQYSEGVY